MSVRRPSPRRSRSNASSMPVEVADVRDGVGQREAAVDREPREPADLDRRVRRAVVAAAQPLLAEQLQRGQRDRRADSARSRRRSPSPPAAARPTPAASWRAARPPRTRGRRRPARAAGPRSAASPSAASTASVAPRRRASSSFAGSRSTAMIRPAPASRAAATICSPTPPQPTTQTLSPSATRAALRTAPKPVMTAHPSSAPCHSGSSGGSGTADAAGTTQRSAKQETKLQCCDGRAVGERQARRAVEQRARPRVLRRRLAEVEAAAPSTRGTRGTAARSRTRRDRPARARRPRPPPTSTTPAPSWPSTIGRGRRRACPRPGAGRCGTRRRPRRGPAPRRRAAASSSTGSIASGRPGARRTAARTSISRPGALRGASRSGSTPRPGPAGGAIVPSAAISTGAGSSQSRRAGAQAGGSSGTSTYGHVETASATCRFASSPSPPSDHVCGENVAPAQVGERGDPPAAAEPAREHRVGLDHVDAAAQHAGRAPRPARAPSRPPRSGSTCAAAARRSRRRRRCGSGSSSQ